jgi:hypothetical protein
VQFISGAFTKRHLSLPPDASQLHNPEPGTEGALPYSMGHTKRMKWVVLNAEQHVIDWLHVLPALQIPACACFPVLVPAICQHSSSVA